MLRSVLHFTTALALLAGASLTFAQASDEAVRVTVMVNSDGSKTVYQTNSVMHEATATTTDQGGQVKGKVVYKLDADGRYETAQILGPHGALRFKSRYRYDEQGRLAEEIQ